ncbi:hypothetical protein NP493_5g17110 [Ridgeia piscesae]|uniref:Lecithin:cholesterol acyltransferase n=1 Tax=Ridgeia piscesae TaxID=27915 RepID=A0AAD9PFI1_RIDPI|nr:hypothetical protein NP493_5g17110 [Ridgeia piscesae]
MASGDDLGVYVLNALSARPEQRSMPSSAWLMPYDTFWNDTEILVTGPHGNYTVNDYKRFFDDLGYPDGYDMRQDTEKLVDPLAPPGVEVYCIHGKIVKTPAAFHYSKKQWFDHQPGVVWGDGDGTVNIRSLHGCLRWQGKQKQKITHKEFAKVDHLGILNNKDVNNYIKTIVLN